MKRLVILVLIALGLAPAVVSAHINSQPLIYHFDVARSSNVISFFDYTADRWNAEVEASADEWTAAFAEAGLPITVVYVNKDHKQCNDVAWEDKQEVISFCTDPVIGGAEGCPLCAYSATQLRNDGLHIKAGLVGIENSDVVYNDAALRDAILCHETAHGMTNLGHPNLDPVTGEPKPESEWVATCVYPTKAEYLFAPGPWDVARIGQAYGA